MPYSKKRTVPYTVQLCVASESPRATLSSSFPRGALPACFLYGLLVYSDSTLNEARRGDCNSHTPSLLHVLEHLRFQFLILGTTRDPLSVILENNSGTPVVVELGDPTADSIRSLRADRAHLGR